jgi:hypothetical protein
MNKHRLTNRDISEQYNKAEFYLMKKGILGMFASWLVQQSSYDTPDITEAVKAYNDFLSIKFNEEEKVVKFTYKELSEYISSDVFGSIPEIEKFNNPKIDNGQTFSTCSRLHKPKADYDFVSLEALSRNIFYGICREHITQPV